MKIISAIYRRVRHHLHDDWAYGNDLDAKPRDFQQQECILKSCIEKFNTTYYDSQVPVSTTIGDSPNVEGGGLGASAPGVGGDTGPVEEEETADKPMDTNYLSILGQKVWTLFHSTVHVCAVVSLIIGHIVLGTIFAL